MRRGFTFLAVALAMVVAIGAASAAVRAPILPNQSAPSPGGSGQAASSNGLQLEASTNGSVFEPGQTVSLTVSVLNTMDAQNVVPSADDWPIQGMGVGPCGSVNYPFGFVLYQGNYPPASGESASQVELYQGADYGCPMILSGISSFSFYPSSDVAIVAGSCQPEPCFSEFMNSTSSISGYWTGGAFADLQPGAYTIAVGDEWGSLVTIHFTVQSEVQGGIVLLPAGTSLEVSSSYDCVAGHYSLPFDASGQSTLSGAYRAGPSGVTLYVATSEQANSTVDGHPGSWLYSTGLNDTASFSVQLGSGSYVLWIEGADMNCGSGIVEPLELLTQVNVTQGFTLSGP